MADPELDPELRQRLVTREPEALTVLFDMYFDRVWSYLRRSINDESLAEDLTQDVFLKIYQALPNYDPERAIRPWIFAIATNRLRDHWRSNAKYANDLSLDVEDSEIELPSDDGLPADLLERQELAGLIGQAVSALPEGTRMVVQLRSYQELSFEEIAEVMGIQVTAARKRFSRGVAALREELGNHPEALA